MKNLKGQYKDKNIELMVNEGCLSGCPMRTSHNLSLPKLNTKYLALNNMFFTTKCNKYSSENLYEYICKSNIIYPWEIEEYNNIGIDQFKLVGRNSYKFSNGDYFDFYEIYLRGIEDYKNIENEKFTTLNNYLCESDNIDIKIKEIISYLPNIEYFKNYGHLCASNCGTECRYCYECAKKIKKNLII